MILNQIPIVHLNFLNTVEDRSIQVSFHLNAFLSDYISSLMIQTGIQPHVTLFHFDAPQVLEDEYGGWLSQKMV